MKSLLDDRPTRQLSQAAPTRPVILVSALMFARRGKSVQEILDVPAPTVFENFLIRHKDEVVVVVVPQNVTGTRVKEMLVTYVDKHEFRTFMLESNDVYHNNQNLRALLDELGVRLRPDTNRTMSIYNIQKFVLAGKLDVLNCDDFDRAGVSPEKEETMQDLIARRQRSSWI